MQEVPVPSNSILGADSPLCKEDSNSSSRRCGARVTAQPYSVKFGAINPVWTAATQPVTCIKARQNLSIISTASFYSQYIVPQEIHNMYDS